MEHVQFVWAELTWANPETLEDRVHSPSKGSVMVTPESLSTPCAPFTPKPTVTPHCFITPITPNTLRHAGVRQQRLLTHRRQWQCLRGGSGMSFKRRSHVSWGSCTANCC